MITKILSWLVSGPLDRLFQTIDHKIDNETERERIKTEAVSRYVEASVSQANSKQWWFPLFFLVPAGLWFTAVCIYSILFCKQCIAPQEWVIAALPNPLDDWMGWIVGSLFVGKAGEMLLSRFK